MKRELKRVLGGVGYRTAPDCYEEGTEMRIEGVGYRTAPDCYEEGTETCI